MCATATPARAGEAALPRCFAPGCAPGGSRGRPGGNTAKLTATKRDDRHNHECRGSGFDIATGAVINGPAMEALNVYEVQEIDGSIQIRA